MAPTVTLPLEHDPAQALANNPVLQRALRIRYALEAGHTPDEAAQLADEALGRRLQRRRSGQRPARRTARRSH